MFGKIGTLLGISRAATIAASSLPDDTNGVVMCHMTKEEAKAKRIAIKKKKAAKMARRRNRSRK